MSLCGANSSLFKISQGVGQGRVLSAFMFLVQINGLLSKIYQNNHVLVLNDIHIQGILLANSTVLMSYSPRSLQCIRNQVEKYAFTWRLHYKPSKMFLLFSTKHKNVLFLIIFHYLVVKFLSLITLFTLVACYRQI